MSSRKEKNRYIILIAAIFLGMSAIVSLIFAGHSQRKREKLKVGVILTGSVSEIGWNKMNYDGIYSACQKYNCKLYVVENVLENKNQCRKAVQKLLDKNVNLIFLTSSSYADEVQDIILKNKKILFYSTNASFSSPNLTTYFVKMYQVRYLAGILAGLTTRTNKIAYIAAMPTSEVNRGISAFALGVKRVNKNASVIVKWTGEWNNTEAEKKALDDILQNENIDFLTYHVNEPNLVYYANEKGIKSIGYHTEVKDCEGCLTSIVCNWGIVYENILSSILSGRKSQKNFWWLGIEEGVVKLTDYSDKVPNDVTFKVESCKNQLLYGFNIFSGEIYDNEGNLHCEKDEALSDDVLQNDFHWLVEGVKEYE